MWAELRKMAMSYDVPLSFGKLPEHLRQCPIHTWRAETGIELIHKEPTRDEQERIWDNWQKMDGEMKSVSDMQSMKLFGMTNKQHHDKLMKEWNNA